MKTNKHVWPKGYKLKHSLWRKPLHKKKQTNKSTSRLLILLLALAAVPCGAGRPGHLLPHRVTGQAACRHTQSQGQTRPRGHVLERNAVLPPAAVLRPHSCFLAPVRLWWLCGGRRRTERRRRNMATWLFCNFAARHTPSNRTSAALRRRVRNNCTTRAFHN